MATAAPIFVVICIAIVLYFFFKLCYKYIKFT